MLGNGAEEALFGAKPQTTVLMGGKEIEEEDRRGEKLDEKGCQRDGDDELTVIARTMKRSELTSETGQLVRYKRHEQEP